MHYLLCHEIYELTKTDGVVLSYELYVLGQYSVGSNVRRLAKTSVQVLAV